MAGTTLHAPKPTLNPPRTLSAGAAWLLAAACLLYIATMFLILGSEPVVGHCGDPASCGITRGLGEASKLLAGFFTVLLWIVLAILLFVGGIKGEKTRSAAMLLLLLSGVAAIFATDLYSRYAGWAIAVPALLPPLLVVYAMLVRRPTLQTPLPAKIVNVAAGGAILILTIAPVPLSAIDASSYAKQEAKAETSREQGEALQRARNAAWFQRLTPNSPLQDFLYDLKYSGRDVDWPPEVAAEVAHHYDQALAKARQVKTRQSDAVTLLHANQIFELQDLWQLDIEATPELCTEYHDRLLENAQWAGAWNLLPRQLPNIKWLVGEHCNLDNALAAIATFYEEFCQPGRWCPKLITRSDRDRISAFTAALAALRRPH